MRDVLVLVQCQLFVQLQSYIDICSRSNISNGADRRLRQRRRAERWKCSTAPEHKRMMNIHHTDGFSCPNKHCGMISQSVWVRTAQPVRGSSVQQQDNPHRRQQKSASSRARKILVFCNNFFRFLVFSFFLVLTYKCWTQNHDPQAQWKVKTSPVSNK